MRFAWLSLVGLLLTGCRNYAEFRLPPAQGTADNTNFQWQAQAEPVLKRGAAGEWDSGDVLNPSVVQFGGRYWNLYSGFDGKTWHTGVATSTDGQVWSKKGKILSPDPKSWEGDDYIAANGAAIVFQGKLLYYYQAGRLPEIGLADSADGATWAKRAKAVLQKGPRGSWDEIAVADPYLIEVGGSLYMFYLGMNRAKQQRLGVATSTDGTKWTKLVSNPILELGAPGAFDENGLGEPAVWQQAGKYWMLYTGRAKNEVRRIGLADSIDGIRWTKRPSFVIEGDQNWNRQVVCDPTVEVVGDAVRIWFGGGNSPKPDEGLNGQIGIARLTVK